MDAGALLLLYIKKMKAKSGFCSSVWLVYFVVAAASGATTLRKLFGLLSD